MAEIADLSDFISRASGKASGQAENVFFYKHAAQNAVAAPASVAGRGYSYWPLDGSPASGLLPISTESLLYASTTGAIKLTAPSGITEKFISQLAYTASLQGTLILYDRMYHKGGFNATATTEQTVQGASPSVIYSRNLTDTSGVGNFMFYEIQSAIGITSRIMTVNYVNQDGTSVSATSLIGTTSFNSVNRAEIIPLKPGDTGIQSVNKFSINATTGTAGSFSIVVGRPLAVMSVNGASGGGCISPVAGFPGPIKIPNDACLGLLWIAGSTTAPNIVGMLSTVCA